MGSRLAVTLESLRLCTSTPLCAALDIAKEAADFLLGKVALVGLEVCWPQALQNIRPSIFGAPMAASGAQ